MYQEIKGHVFEVRRDMIDITSNISVPDPAWREICACGEKHRITKAGVTPTFRWITDCPADDEYPESGFYACKKCNKKIIPGTTSPPPYKTHIPGLKYCLIDGEEVSHTTFKKELRKAKN